MSETDIDEIRDSVPDWRALYDAAAEQVFHVAYRITGDADLAEDITHDTFVRAWERRDQYRGRGPVVGWVCTVARNLARDQMRRGRFTETLAEREEALLPGEPLADAELGIVVAKAVEQLSPDHREVLLLHAVDGYSHPEISEMLGIPVGTSKARLSRARAQLKNLVEAPTASTHRGTHTE